MTVSDQTLFYQMRRNRDVLFFVSNGLGWSAWGTAQYLGFTFYAKPNERFEFVILSAVVAGFLLTIPLRYLGRKLWHQPPIIMVGGALLAAYLTALPMRVVINLAQQRFVEPWAVFNHWYEIFMGVLWTTYLIACWMALYLGFRFYESNQKERESTLRAMALAQAAQLKMLRYQLNPHFLFNTLNAISTLILDKQNPLANTVVTRLGNFLRYTLDQDPMKTVTLTQELDAIGLYLDIERLRFGARLTVEVNVTPPAGEAAVPSLILQPLIENAIKYAVAPREQGGVLKISGRIEADLLSLRVEDNGPGLIDTSRIDNSLGVGLRNTRERLQVLYGERAVFRVNNIEPGLRVELVFPAQPIEVAP
ncbi:MAG: histidine kinase [Candidatus Obscuribacterales bacterium]|nr:histidine kinase [Steroidobacteraceae bacterium]